MRKIFFLVQRIACIFLISGTMMIGPSFASPSDTEKQSLLAPVDGGIAVFPPGKEEKWLWQVDPTQAAYATATRLDWTLRYWDGMEEKGEVLLPKAAAPTTPATVSPAASSTAPEFAFTPTRLGWAELSTQLLDGNGKVLTSEHTTLAIGTPDRTPQRNFRYGYCVHSDRDTDAEYKLSIQMLGASGVDIIRDGSPWGKMEVTQGNWDFSKMDRLVNDTAANGIEVQALFVFTAQWATTGDAHSKNWHEWNNKMPQMEPWLAYVKTMVNRYGNRIHNWEVWNEPDHSFWLDTPENYLLLFNETAKAVKETNPSDHVMNGGLTFIRTPQDEAVRKNLFTSGDKADWDIFAYHSYMTLEQLMGKSKEVDQALAGTGLEKLPRWLNESGFHTLAVDAEHSQVLELIKKISLSPALKINAYFWYDLRDDGVDSHTTENRMGTSDYFYRPRPAYAAYQNLIRELASRSYFSHPDAGAQPSQTADGIWLAGYAGGKGGEHRMVAWREGTVTCPTVLKWPEGTAIKSVDDVMGNPVEIFHIGKYAVVPIGANPVYIAFTGEATYPETSSFLQLPAVTAALPGQTSPLNLGLSNPTSDPLPISLKGSLGGKQLFAQDYQLKAGETQDMTFNIAWPTEKMDNGKIDLEVNFPATGTHFNTELPFETAHVLPRVLSPPGKDLPPQFTLNQRENIINLAEGLGLADRDWKGPADLSATASFTYDETMLHLLINVEDDVHFQEGNVLKLWEDDSVQFAIKINAADLKYFQGSIGLVPGKEPVTWVDKASASGHLPLGAFPPEVIRTVERTGTQTIYRIDIPWVALGSEGVPKAPFRMSFVVNDNDGSGRRQWLELSPGIGKLQNPSLFPLFICK